MNNKFALSFGISLVIVGLLNIFFETSNIILFGLSVSTTIFSIMNMFEHKIINKKLELLYVIPFVLLVSIFCYSNSLMKNEIISDVVNSKITNILTFISFGLLFISEFINYNNAKKQYINFQMAMITDNLQYSALILGLQNEYLQSTTKNPSSMEIESKKFFDDIEKLCNEKIRLSRIDIELLEQNKGLFTIQDLNMVYQKHHDILDINGKIEKYNEKLKNKNNH
ncbi:MAG: hypothetical protein MRZ34_04770 [Bacillales bacterium]|nr:hypothetical protein [Bacillales bacterium]